VTRGGDVCPRDRESCIQYIVESRAGAMWKFVYPVSISGSL